MPVAVGSPPGNVMADTIKWVVFCIVVLNTKQLILIPDTSRLPDRRHGANSTPPDTWRRAHSRYGSDRGYGIDGFDSVSSVIMNICFFHRELDVTLESSCFIVHSCRLHFPELQFCVLSFRKSTIYS